MVCQITDRFKGQKSGMGLAIPYTMTRKSDNLRPFEEDTMADPITTLANGIMTAVAEAWARGRVKPQDLDQAVQVMRDQLKSFLTGQEYQDTREALLAGTLSQQWAMADLVTGILTKIPTVSR